MPRIPHNTNLKQGLALTLLTTLALLAGALLLSTTGRVQGRSANAPAAPVATGTASPTPFCPSIWSIVSSPNIGTGYNTLAAVASVSANDVWAVGTYQSASSAFPLALHWDGTLWSSVPITATGASSSLLGVAAVGSTDVWAVGTSDGSTFVEHWNGTAWSVVASPDGGPNGNFLWGVTALAANDVWAVGYSFDATNGKHTLIEHWNGTAWAIVSSPNNGTGSSLISVSGLTANDIWAVGTYTDGGGQDQAQTFHWDGTTWSDVGVSLGAQSSTLRGVTMVSSTDVWAVGSSQIASGSQSQGMMIRWNGSFWSPYALPNFTQASTLLSVSAASSTDVWAVGSYSDGTTYQTMTIHWNGTSLDWISSPNLGSDTNTLSGVSARFGDVWAVGLGNANRTLVERYAHQCITPQPTATATPLCSTGWNVVTSPNVLTSSNTLNGVFAVNTANVWAVGSSSTAAHTLTMRWNGGYWLVVPSPDGGTGPNELLAVAGTGASDLWAVGYAGNPVLSTLVLHWNGSSWSRIPSPDVGTRGSRLLAVTARTTTDAWAVGTYVETTGDEQTLIEHWDGLTWSVVASPNGDPEGSFLRGVTALAANNAWAVGYTVHHDPATPTATATPLSGRQSAAPKQPAHAFEALIEHWDGTAWTIIAGPELPEAHYLRAVAAVSANNVWAVGFIGDTAQQTLIEHWDGTSWSAVPSPNAGTVSNNLLGLTPIGPNDIWAVGSYINTLGANQTLMLHWNGTAWSLVLPPNGGAGNNALNGISALNANDIWAVGFASDATGPTRTLIEHYGGPCATPVSSPTRTPTPTVCAVQFNDVPVGSTFYDVIRCLACRGIISGYPCGGPGEPCPGGYYRVGNNVTRGQTAKIVASSAGFAEPVPSTQQTYEDVAPGSTFHLYVERLSSRGIISGYPCGGPFEPCVAPANRPYFRPNNNVTRGQLAKIGANAAGYTETPTGQTFEDAPPNSTFYLFIERLAGRGIMSGYPCSGAGEPCVAPTNRPYFRPNGPATRGQTAKIVANTFFPNCQTPARR